ncbi:hypothetical protein IV203_013068 [Nitzschia inconspicua]|uniref:Uncharacterized protein n=1 Tax=Nitzschia inconspicua TaxID=303405 RepID=A0A9K3M4F0_9STRA|nr:hypothetical protein IV203_013068 [Nitzschia inconspicua]
MTPLLVAAGGLSRQNNLIALAERALSSPSSSSVRTVMAQHDEDVGQSRSSIFASSSNQQQQQQQHPYHHHYDFKTKLPRVELQLLCSHDIVPDFDVTTTFRNFYQEFFLAALSHTDNDIDGDASSGSWNNVAANDMDDDAGPFVTELFTFVSRSTVQDVKPHEVFYDTCDPSSETVLVTMDVRGYIHVRTKKDAATSMNVNMDGPLDGFRTQENLQQLIEEVNALAIKDYLAQHVCLPVGTNDDSRYHSTNTRHKNGTANNATDTNDPNDEYASMEYFKAKVRPWNTHLAPPPPSSSRDYPYPSTKDHKHFEHNLRLLCEGGVDAVYPNYHKQVWTGPESTSSLVIGIVVGMIMVGIICRELNQKRHPSIRERLRRQRGPQEHDGVGRNWRSSSASDRAVVVVPVNPTTEGYEATSQDEIELV